MISINDNTVLDDDDDGDDGDDDIDDDDDDDDNNKSNYVAFKSKIKIHCASQQQ